jgi:hypothetical protein
MLGTIRPTRTLFLIRHIRRNVSVAQNANAPTPIRDSLHDPPARDPPAKPVTRVRSSLHRLAPFAFVRFLMIFFIGVVATLAWQSYGRAAREVIARWLVDKLAADITKLQATKQGTPDGAARLPSAADVPVQKPVPPTPPRAPPMR